MGLDTRPAPQTQPVASCSCSAPETVASAAAATAGGAPAAAPSAVAAEGHLYASMRELLDWVNGLLSLQLTRLEQFASGAVFCQMLDAHFQGAIPMSKVNYHVRNEYEALTNYKVLQLGFTHISLTRDLAVSKLSRGSPVELLELTQYLYKYLLKLKAREGYNARERRAGTLRGATDTVPLPPWMSGSHAAGRSGVDRSSRSWSVQHESGRTSVGRTSGPLRAGGSFTPAAVHATARRTSGAAAASPAREGAAAAATAAAALPGGRRPCAPLRTPSASPSKDRGGGESGDVCAPAGSAIPTPSRAAPTPRLAGRRAEEGPEDEVGTTAVCVRIVATEDSMAAAHAAPADDGCATRLVTEADLSQRMQRRAAAPSEASGAGDQPPAPSAAQPQLHACSCLASDVWRHGPHVHTILQRAYTIACRPLSASSRTLVDACLAAAASALAALRSASAGLARLAAHHRDGAAADAASGTTSDSFALRGKARSLADAADTVAGHAALLLSDVSAECARRAHGSADEVAGSCAALAQELAALRADQLEPALAALSAATAAHPLGTPLGESCSSSLAPLTAQQKAVAVTSALDTSLRALGAAHAALLGRSHALSAAVAAQFLQDPASCSGAAAPAELRSAVCAAVTSCGAPPSRVLRLGDAAMKQLRNGDVYKGRYAGPRKHGDGSYFFSTTCDVYEGEFGSDRMCGAGVYSFATEGRYEGEWAGATYEGAGSETFARGSTYRGMYRANLRDGWGACRFYNGDYYEGAWAAGARHGCGMQQCTDDSSYVGEYKGGKRHGVGVYMFPNGDLYAGSYEEDIPQGWGVYTFSGGQKYEGCWHQGKKHGYSVYTVETGQRWAGSWCDGKPSWVHPLPSEVTGVTTAAESVPQTQPDAEEKMAQALAACAHAQEAAAAAHAKMAAHWAPGGEVQAGIEAALAAASRASQAAHAARARAQHLAARLDAAVALVDDGARGAEMRLVTHASLAEATA